MDKYEYNSWQRVMRSAQGRWTLDLIHNGTEGRDYLFFKGQGYGSGVFLAVADHQRTEQCLTGRLPNEPRHVLVSAGRYTQAIPHIGEAEFKPVCEFSFLGSAAEAVDFLRANGRV